MNKLGRLKEVNVRDLWKHEQYDFSNWLSRDENLELLNDALDLSLIDVDKEVYVGSYRCDLVARDEGSGAKVIIENQLETTNHDHLGKIITYASGLNARVIIWIVQSAREEHRSAIEWLNNNTGNDINFFLIELHAYKIGDSLPAPKFEIVEEPNTFVKSGKGVGGKEITKSQSERFAFWEQFAEVVENHGKPFNVHKANYDSWTTISMGSSKAYISVDLINKEGRVRVGLYIGNSKETFDKLHKHKDDIETEIGMPLEWLRLEGKKASRVITFIDGLDFDDHSGYEELMGEICDTIVKMRPVFSKYI